MRLIFMGTPDFAVASLDILLTNGFEVAAVVTAPDRPAGRGLQLQESAVKKYALLKGLKILQPQKLRDQTFINELKTIAADLQVVVAFRMLPEEVWNMPPLGTYNLHASLLPKYRGAAPINWAIIKGEVETGVTTFRLKHQIDTGNILYSEKVEIPSHFNAGHLHDSLMEKGGGLVLKTVKAIAEKGGNLPFRMQDDSLASHAPKIFKNDCRINWQAHGRDIHNLVRGLSPHPGAFTILSNGGEELVLKIYETEFSEIAHNESNGSLFTDNASVLKIYCTGGHLLVRDVQLQGKKRMRVEAFLRGFKFGPQTILK